MKCFDIFGHKYRNGFSMLPKRMTLNFIDQIPPYPCTWNSVLLPAFHLVQFLNLAGKMNLYDCAEKNYLRGVSKLRGALSDTNITAWEIQCYHQTP